ncbi:MAG: methyltransferase family protein [Alphaproteobacteria bacterium]
MRVFIYFATAVLPFLALFLVRRIGREHDFRGCLTWATSFAVWLLYLPHVALTVWSAWISLWPLPINATVAPVAGSVLLLAGTALCAAGIIRFASLSRMSGMKTDRLITTGVYRWSRNPQNVGLGVALVGLAFSGRSGFAILLTALFWITLQIYLPTEEVYVARIFGESFEDYCRQTSRYLGIHSR